MGADKANVSELVAEFAGTFLLIFTIGCNVLTGGAWAGVSIACVLMVAIFSFGGISGANFNPAVSATLCMGIKDNDGNAIMSPLKAAMYSGVQIAAGIAAGFCYRGIFGKSIPLGPAAGFNIFTAGACETLYTFMLCFVVLNVAAVKKGCQDWFGLAIGFVIIAGAYGAGAVSGGCFNPAVALGLDISHAFVPYYSLAYLVFELLGAGLAAALFKVVRPEGGTEEEGKLTANDKSIAVVLTSEFIGTYILVLTVGLNVLAKSPAAAFSIAASLMCMIYALGDVSGGVFNPAVAVAVQIHNPEALGGWGKVGMYIGAEVAGGIAAAFTYMFIHNGEAFPLAPGAGYSMVQALVAEFVFTLVLCLVVLCAAVNAKTKSDKFFALAIGSCVTVGGFAIGAVSGGSLNPAVSFGIATSALVKHGANSMLNACFYSILEFVGAVGAAGIVMVTHAAGSEKETPKEP
jgi:aquaporin Z